LFTVAGRCAQPLVNVKTFGATGNGIDDDAPFIRKALKAGVSLYFPSGQYKLCSNESSPSALHFLTLSSANNGTLLYWHEDAVFFVCEEFTSDKNPIRIFQIKNKPRNGEQDGDIKNITLICPNIDGRNRTHTTKENPRLGGISLIEDEGYTIEGINIIRPNVKNCTGNGITSWNAKQADIYEAHTKNNRKQGIGVRNIYNEEPISLNIYGHTSIEDGMSVDWSGNTIVDGACNEEFKGVGKAYNLRSINPKYGIKTAGTWDLFIHDMEITGSKNNGFWNNCNAPNATTIMEKVSIKNCKGNGVSLRESKVIMRDVEIANNGCDFKSVGTDILINNLKIESTNENGCGMRMSGENIYVEDFNILAENHNGGQYALWLYGNVVMINGQIDSKNQGVIFRPLDGNDSGTLCFDDVTIKNEITGITSIGENHLFLKDCIINAKGRDVRLIDENNQPNPADQTVIVNNTEIEPDVGQIEDTFHYCTLLNDRIGLNESNKTILNNYPNPFSNSTTILFNLPKEIENASLAVYDLTGKLLNNYLVTESGSFKFESGELANGTYLYSIIVDGETLASNKLIIQR